jgi:hypothetical protein
MHEIRSFKVWQTARVSAALAAIWTLFEFPFLILVAQLVERELHLRHWQIVFSIVANVIMAAVLVFILTALFCWLYNLIAPRIGGVAFELTPRSEN